MTRGESGHVYRVDKFAVPAAARAEFLEQVLRTHVLLREQPGFVRDLVLEQTAGPGRFNFVTLVEWTSQQAIAGAKKTVGAAQARAGFNPQVLFARLGIEADLAYYGAVGQG